VIDATSTSLEALTQRYEAIAHNLANANTAGYKRLVTAFLHGDAQQPDGAAATTAAAGSGGIVGRTLVDFTQGALTQTGRPLDLALHGKGFFVVESPEGQVYTRNGIFQVNAAGQLVDSVGRTVIGESGPIVIPAGTSAMSVSVAADGRIIVGEKVIGKIRIVEFERPQDLQMIGQCSLRAPQGTTPKAATATTVEQGFQEASNVAVVDELVGLITVSRLYEANFKTVEMRGERTKSILQVAMG